MIGFKISPPKADQSLAGNSQRGLTLVELVVVLAIFMLIIGAAVTMFVSVISHQQRILQEQDLANQASYALDYISRSVRTAIKDVTGNCLIDNGVEHPGYHYLLTHYNATSGYYEGLKFLANDNVCEEFFIDTDKVFKEIKNGGTPQPFLSDKFNLLYARFVVNGDKDLQGASQGDSSQPRLTLALNIQTQAHGAPKETVVQTTISQINLNVQ